MWIYNNEQFHSSISEISLRKLFKNADSIFVVVKNYSTPTN